MSRACLFSASAALVVLLFANISTKAALVKDEHIGDAALILGAHLHTHWDDGSRDYTEVAEALRIRGINGLIYTAHADGLTSIEKKVNLALTYSRPNRVGIENYIKAILSLSKIGLTALPGIEIAEPWKLNGKTVQGHAWIPDCSNPELQRLIYGSLNQDGCISSVIEWCNANQLATVAAHPTHRHPGLPTTINKRLPREVNFSYPLDCPRMGMPRLWECFNNGTIDREQDTVDKLLELLMKGHRLGVISGNDFHTRISTADADILNPDRHPAYRKNYAEGRISSRWDRVTGVYPERPGAEKPGTKDAVLKALWDGRCDARCRYAMRVTKCQPFPSIEPVEVDLPGIDVELTGLGTKYKAEAQIWLIGPGITDQVSDVITLGGANVAGDTTRITWRDPNGRYRLAGQEVTIVLHVPERYVAVWHQRVTGAAAATPDPRLTGWHIVIASGSKQSEPAGARFKSGDTTDVNRYSVFVYGPGAVPFELFVTMVTDDGERITKRQRHFPPTGRRTWRSAVAISNPWSKAVPGSPGPLPVKERIYEVRLLEAEKDERGKPIYGPTVATFSIRRK